MNKFELELWELTRKRDHLYQTIRGLENSIELINKEIEDLEESEALSKFKDKIVRVHNFVFVFKGYGTSRTYCEHSGKVVLIKSGKEYIGRGGKYHLSFTSPKEMLKEAKLATPEEIQIFRLTEIKQWY